MQCNWCPRNCNVDRQQYLGNCGAPQEIKIARAALHFWEEPCVSGNQGSGTVFFSGCNLHCVYCQNQEISQQAFGKIISLARLQDIFLDLQCQKAHNINLVTPTHYGYAILKSVAMAREKGLKIPVIYNTNGYEKVHALHKLAGTVDVYLTDFKYMDDAVAQRYSGVKDYASVAKQALGEMVRQTGPCVFDTEGLIQKGVIVRVLVLPSHTAQAKNIIQYLYDTYKDDIYISIMSQYTPCGDLANYAELGRALSPAEYEDVVNFAIDIGIENGFVQEGESATESFIPPFDLTGV